MKQLKKSFFREAAEQFWDDQESALDAYSDLSFNEIDFEDMHDEEEQDLDEPVG